MTGWPALGVGAGGAGGMSGGRATVERGSGGRPGGIGGAKPGAGRGGVIGGRGGATGREACGVGNEGIGRTGVGGTAAAGATAGTDTGVGAAGGAGGTGALAVGVGAWTTGVANGVDRLISGNAGTSPEGRARATTPGVNVGVGLRDCAGGLNGVENGSDGRGGGGPSDWSAGTTGVGTEARGLGGSNASGAASESDSMATREGASQARPAPAWAGSSIPTRITAPQTEHLARTPPGGTFAGSTRKTDWHSAHVTFNAPPWPVPWTLA